MSRVKVAAVQFEPTMFDKECNISRLLEVSEQAAISGARLIVTPEMGTTGYCWFDRAEVAPFDEPVPGPTTSRFAALAKQHGCHIVVGMPEVDDDGIYFNFAVLIGPDGIVGRHRKSHPYISEPKWAHRSRWKRRLVDRWGRWGCTRGHRPCRRAVAPAWGRAGVRPA